MRLLYVSDNGFSFYEGKYYYSTPNHLISSILSVYFDSITYLARNNEYDKNSIHIDNSKVILVPQNSLRALRKAMIENEQYYDIVFAQNGINSVLAAFQAKKMGKKVISYCGADPLALQLSRRDIFSFFKGIIWFALERRKMKVADFAHYCTDVLHKKYPCKCDYLICSNVFVDVKNTILAKRLERKIDKSRIKIGLIGQINNNNKGIDVAIKALRELSSQFELQIVGGGNKTQWEELANQIGVKDRVHFLGYIADTEQINSWLDDCDIYIQPSLSEGLPRSTIEAMARGCPVVATNVGAIPSLIEKEYLIKPRDYTGLARKIQCLIDNDEKYKEQERRNFEHAKQYDYRVRDQKIEGFYQRIK